MANYKGLNNVVKRSHSPNLKKESYSEVQAKTREQILTLMLDYQAAGRQRVNFLRHHQEYGFKDKGEMIRNEDLIIYRTVGCR